MKDLRKRTFTDENIVKTVDNLYRYINHEDKVATIGFSSIAELQEHAESVILNKTFIECLESVYMAQCCSAYSLLVEYLYDSEKKVGEIPFRVNRVRVGTIKPVGKEW